MIKMRLYFGQALNTAIQTPTGSLQRLDDRLQAGNREIQRLQGIPDFGAVQHLIPGSTVLQVVAAGSLELLDDLAAMGHLITHHGHSTTGFRCLSQHISAQIGNLFYRQGRTEELRGRFGCLVRFIDYEYRCAGQDFTKTTVLDGHIRKQ